MKSDFDIYTGMANGVWEGGFGDGEPILHAALDNPLPPILGSTFCRRFMLARADINSPYPGGNVLASLSNQIDNGVYLSIDDSRTLDMRFHARSENAVTAGMNVGAACRYRADTLHSASTPEGFDGYGMSFGPVLNYGAEEHHGNGNLPGVLYLRLWARQNMALIGNNQAGLREVLLDTNPLTSAVWQPFTWYRFRFKLVPQAGVGVTLTAFVLNDLTANDDMEGNWTEVGRMDVGIEDTWYVPLGSGQRVGWYTAANAGAYPPPGPSMLFDNFEARVVTD